MEKFNVLLSPSEQVAYLWIHILRRKVSEIYQEPRSFGHIGQEFLSVFGSFDEINWRELYIKLQEYAVQISIEDINRKGYQQLNKVLMKIFGVRIPNTNSDRVYSQLPKKAQVFSKTKKGLSIAYDGSYDYVLNDSKKEYDFYKLILDIIRVIRIKDKSFNSLNYLKNFFCEIYIEINKMDIEPSEIERRFDRVIDVLSSYSIIEVSSGTIERWPIGDTESNDLVNYYSDVILREYHKVKEFTSRKYISPVTRSERRHGDSLVVINNKKQGKIVETITSEIKKFQVELDTKGVAYFEQFQSAHCIGLSDFSLDELKAIETMGDYHYSLCDVKNTEFNTGWPLVTVEIQDINGMFHECDFDRVKLFYRDNIARWGISFSNDGTISLSKSYKLEEAHDWETSKWENKDVNSEESLDYAISYNLVSRNFEISNIGRKNAFLLSLNGDILNMFTEEGTISIDTVSSSKKVECCGKYDDNITIMLRETRNCKGKIVSMIEVQHSNGKVSKIRIDVFYKRYYQGEKIFGDDLDRFIIELINTKLDKLKNNLYNVPSLVAKIKEEMPMECLEERLDSILSLFNGDTISQGDRVLRKVVGESAQ